MNRVYVDSTAWIALIDQQDVNHALAVEYFQQSMEKRYRLYSNMSEINSAIDTIKERCGLHIAQEFNQIIDESIVSTNLQVGWVTRRLRRMSLKHYFSIQENGIRLNHCIIYSEVKRKRINFIFSFDDALKLFEIPMMPQR